MTLPQRQRHIHDTFKTLQDTELSVSVSPWLRGRDRCHYNEEKFWSKSTIFLICSRNDKSFMSGCNIVFLQFKYNVLTLLECHLQ